MPRSPLDGAAHAVQDAAYVTVGLGILAYQRMQVRRRALETSLGEPGAVASGAVDLITAAVADRVKLLEERLGAALEHR